MQRHPACGELSDALLADAARKGDRRSLAELLERHRPLLLALCRRTLGGEVLAEDVAQDACLCPKACADGSRQRRAPTTPR